MEFRVLIVLCGLLVLNSCTKEVKIDIPGYEKQLVVDGSIREGEPPIVLLSTTQNIYAPTDISAYLASFVSDAVVTISDGTNTVTLSKVCTDNLPPGTEPLLTRVSSVKLEKPIR
ncbi:MAG: DUF4249 family protein [Flavobacteriia bacterium]|nr:DUF4249 family protein [Flavobacteriia bacterium]